MNYFNRKYKKEEVLAHMGCIRQIAEQHLGYWCRGDTEQ